MEKKPQHHWSLHLSEATVWIIVLVLLAVTRVYTDRIFDDLSTIWIVGLILIFALAYYTFAIRYFDDRKRRYIKDLADVVFIGILGSVAKDYSIYLFSLYIIPIAAAAFALDILNSLVIATVACLFIAGNVILNTGVFAGAEPLYFGTFQIVLFFVLTIFVRTLALQLRNEQEERRYFQDKLRQVDAKIADVEATEQEFVSITTHQLNTPLSIIRGYTSMLLAGDAGKLNEKQAQYVNEIHGGALRLSKVIKDLLDITHLDRDKFLENTHQPVDLTQTINNATGRHLEHASTRQITITTQLAKEPLVVLGNATHLEEAIGNLLENAIKYSNEKTTITLTSTKEKGPTGYDAIVTVSDQGIGIPEKEKSLIFQRFYRATNSEAYDAQGTGLGLYIVQRIVEAHGGSISFTSEVNQGTTFKLRLPLVKVASPAPASASPTKSTKVTKS